MVDRLDGYIDFLLDYTRKINVISKNISRDQVRQLIDESILVARQVSQPLLIDAGSGNGLLGIPLALSFPERRIALVESTMKKVTFLRSAVSCLGLANSDIFHGSIQEFMHHQKDRRATLVARGFPDNQVLGRFVVKGQVRELVLITSPDKVKKMGGAMENVRQKQYNIPFRDKLIILKLESVSRGT